MKPKQQDGYSAENTELCERTLVTLLRGLGPWKKSITLIGGLVPRYLIKQDPGDESRPQHIGTTDIDIVLDLKLLVNIEAYEKLEQNLKNMGFERGVNAEGNPQHFKWRKRIPAVATIEVDLLCDTETEEGGRAKTLPNERRLSALNIPGTHLAIQDCVEKDVKAELLDEGGTSTEKIRIANIVPFIVLKALAYEDRNENKDAYDFIYCLTYFKSGPEDVAAEFSKQMEKYPDEPLFQEALEILRKRFASDDQTEGYLKDGPTSYANFMANPDQRDQNRRNASGVVEALLELLDA